MDIIITVIIALAALCVGVAVTIAIQRNMAHTRAKGILEEAEKEDPDFKANMMDVIVHKEENRELEQVSFNFQIPISLSVLTHLTRHRMHSLLVPNFVPLWNFNNYIIPETIKNSRPDIMELLAADIDKIKEEANSNFYDPRELLEG